MNKPRGRPPKAKLMEAPQILPIPGPYYPPEVPSGFSVGDKLPIITSAPEPQISVQSELHKLLGMMSDINFGRDGG